MKLPAGVGTLLLGTGDRVVDQIREQMEAPQASVFSPLVTRLVHLDGHINFTCLDERCGNDRLGMDFFGWHRRVNPPLGV